VHAQSEANVIPYCPAALATRKARQT